AVGLPLFDRQRDRRLAHLGERRQARLQAHADAAEQRGLRRAGPVGHRVVHVAGGDDVSAGAAALPAPRSSRWADRALNAIIAGLLAVLVLGVALRATGT